MNWNELSIQEKANLMKLYVANGVTDLDTIKQHYNSFATGGSLPDHDPKNPYHYHNAQGEKVVITPDDWKANVGKPYFKEIEAAVRAEQSAHPVPEYEVNPDFVRDLRSVYKNNMGNNYQNYRYFASALPEGYSFTDEGLIVDPQGNYYVQSGFMQSPRFTYNSNSPLQFTINEGKPIEKTLTFYPVNMDRRVKASLPVNEIMNVVEKKRQSVKNTYSIESHILGHGFQGDEYETYPIPKGTKIVGNRLVTSDKSILDRLINNARKNRPDYNNWKIDTTESQGVIPVNPAITQDGQFTHIDFSTGRPVIKQQSDFNFQIGGKLTFNEWKSQMQSKYPDIEMDNTKAGYDYNRYFNDNYDDAIRQLSELKHFPDTYKLPNHKTFSNESIYSRGPMMGGNWVNDSTFSPSVINRRQYPNIYKEDRPYTEREIYGDEYQQGGHLYQEGGPANNKSDWAKAHETELSLQQLGWDNPDNKLHSDYAAKDDKGYYAGYNLKPVTVRPSVQQLLIDRGKNNSKAYGIVEQFDPEAAKFNNQWGLGLWATLIGAKAPELIKDATVKGFETLNKVYNPTKWYGAGLTAVTAAKPLVDLTSMSNYTDENGKYNTGNAWNNISNWTTDAVFASPAFNAGKQGVKAATDAFKYNTTLGRNITIANELRKGINSNTLTTTPVENAVHNRFRLGDVEINDPNLMYRQTDSRALGEVASGGNRHTMFNRGSLWYGIPTESMLNPVIEPKTVGKLKLTKPNSEVAKTHLLVTRNADMTGANQKFGRVSIGPHSESSLHLNIEKSPEDRWLNEMIREWRNKNSEPGIATYVTDGGSRRVPLEGALNNSNTSIYTFDSGYGYRRIQEPTPTLEQAYQEATVNQQNNPIVFARSLSNEGVDNVLRDNYLEGSPSFALTRYSDNNLGRLSDLYSGDEGITFLFGKNAAGNNAKYFIGDADTPIRQDAARALNLPATDEAINNITPEQVMLGKRLLHKDINSTPINQREAFNLTRENNFGDMNYFYNEVLLDKILDYRDAIGAIVNTNKPQYIKMLEDLGIPYGYNLTDIPFNFKGFQRGGFLGKVTPYGQWQYPHQITTIPSNNITMKGVNYPVIGVSNTGDTKYMLPNMDYLFDGQYVTEYPINK